MHEATGIGTHIKIPASDSKQFHHGDTLKEFLERVEFKTKISRRQKKQHENALNPKSI